MSDFTPWINKYVPKKLSEVRGQEYGVSQLKKFVEDFRKGKALFLYGPTGTGKTASVAALARELGYELVEINASDSRKADEIESLIGSAASQRSLFYKSKIILIDEVDGVSGQKDRGGIPAIEKIISKSSFPIVLAANDPYDKKFSNLRKKATLVEFKAKHHEEIFSILKDICTKEKIEFDDDALTTIARRCGGDARAAINDLQSISATEKKITKKELVEFGERDNTESIVNAMLKVFKTTSADIALGAFDNVNEDIDKIFLWMDENLPLEYDRPEDLCRAYDAVSRADVFFGRIRRWQYYRFYVYCYALLSVGVALAKEEKYRKIVKYRQTERILKLWLANQKNAKKKAIAEKIADNTHTSIKEAFRDSLYYLKPIFKHSKKKADEIAEFLELDPEQVEWMRR